MVRVALPQQPPFSVSLLFSLSILSFLLLFSGPSSCSRFSRGSCLFFPCPLLLGFSPRCARPLAGNGRNIEGSRIRMNTLKRGNKKQQRRRVGRGRAGVARGSGGNGESRINNALRGHAKINMRTKEPAERNEAIAPTRATPLENSARRNGVRIEMFWMYLLRCGSGFRESLYAGESRISVGTKRACLEA